MSRGASFSVMVAVLMALLADVGHAQFSTIINSPPTPIGDNQGVLSDTQLNLLDSGSVGISFSVGASDGSSENVEFNISGGAVGDRLEVFGGSTVNISGGSIGPFFDANDGGVINVTGGSVGTDFDSFAGSVVNISGGTIGNRFEVGSGSTVRLSGGSFGDQFETRSGSTVTVSGGDFRLNGALVNDVGSVDIPLGATLTGSLADGSPFAFSTSDDDSIANGSLTLQAVDLPPVGPLQITASIDSVPQGIREGQVLTVDSGGNVGDHFGAGWGSRVRVEQGGFVGANFEAVGSTVEIVGGSVGRDLDAFVGSNVSISGGSVGDGFAAHNGGSVAITGGSVGARFTAKSGSTVTISGGLIGEELKAFEGSAITITGGDYRIDGVPVADLGIVDIRDGVSLTGSLADGSSFAFSSGDGDAFASGALTLQAADLPPIGPLLITASRDLVPQSIRDGQELVVDSGGIVTDDFVAGWGSRVRIEPGSSVGDNFEAVGSVVTIAGGTVGHGADAFADSSVTISGGTVGDGFDANNGSVVTISGGTVGDRFSANNGSNVSIAGGSVGNEFDANDGSSVTISGGAVGSFFDAKGGSTVRISGGSIGQRFDADDGSTVVITGGSVGDRLNAKGGSNVSIAGGTLGIRFEAVGGSMVELSGGAVGDQFRSFTGSALTITGGEFRLDGVLVDEIGGFTVPGGAALTGTLADGSPFAFSSDDGDSFASGSLTLKAAELAPIGPSLITASTDVVPLGIRDGQTLVVDNGGSAGEHFGVGWGSTIIVEEGGNVGANLEAVGSTVNVSGGTVGRDFDAFTGSTVTLSFGTIGDRFDANSGSIVLIAGGMVGAGFDANNGSAVTISGGLVGEDFDASAGSTVAISGGEFRLDGELVEPGPMNVPDGSSLSGTLADGNPFAFTSGDSDVFANGTLVLQTADLPPIGPLLITASADPVPSGIRSGQQLVVGDNGVVGDHFGAGWGASVRVEQGGVVGENFEAVGSVVTIVGGSIGDDFDAVSRSTVTLSSGTIGVGFDASNGTQVTITGGAIGDEFSANTGSLIQIDGGAVGSQFEVHSGSSVTIANGDIGDELNANDGTTITIAGGTVGEFLIANGGSDVTISGGAVGNGVDALNGSVVTISGGTVGDQFDAFNGSTVNVSGGTIGDGFDANSGSTVTITGGTFGDDFDAFSGSTVTISGGTLGAGFDANGGSMINLHGVEFSLNGVPVVGLDSPGDSLVVNEREGQVLSVTLRDKSVLDFTLLGIRSFDDFFSPDATLQLFLVEPLAACDFDGDGLCNLSDVDALVGEIANGAGQPSFDQNSDGVVDASDLAEWLSDAAAKNGLAGSYIAGDADLDGTVDAEDLNRLGLHWTQDVPLWSAGDFTADGTVDPADLNVLGLNWQKSVSVPQTSAVPEPDASTLFICIVLAVLLKRRR